jgi:hypothetical protein
VQPGKRQVRILKQSPASFPYAGLAGFGLASQGFQQRNGGEPLMRRPEVCFGDQQALRDQPADGSFQIDIRHRDPVDQDGKGIAIATGIAAGDLTNARDREDYVGAGHSGAVDQHLSAAYTEAHAKLPAWARPGHRSIDQDGNPCGEICNWPLDETVTLPPLNAWRVVRPSIWDAKENFDFGVRVFHWTGKHRAAQRATMRRTVRDIIGRLRERSRLRNELGLTELNRQIEATTDAEIEAEDFFLECDDETPNIVAARLMIGLTNDCQKDAIAEGNGYCGTMAMALVALKGLLPNLSGLILRSAEREAGWRATNDEGVGEVGRRKSDHQLAAVRR